MWTTSRKAVKKTLCFQSNLGVRIEIRGRAERAPGCGDIAQARLDESQGQPDTLVSLVDSDSVFQRFDRLVTTARVMERQSQIIVDVHVARRLLEDARVFGGCLQIKAV